MGFGYEAEANKRLACHNESRDTVSSRQCESILSHIHLLNKPPCACAAEKKDQLTPYLAVSPLKLTLSLGESKTVFGTAWLHFLPEWTPGPKGTPRQICMPLAILCYLLQIYYCGKLLPQQQLRGLFKSKWYLQAVRRHIEIPRARTHTKIGEKTASKSNHGYQNTAVSRAKRRVMPLMKCWTI